MGDEAEELSAESATSSSSTYPILTFAGEQFGKSLLFHDLSEDGPSRAADGARPGPRPRGLGGLRTVGTVTAAHALAGRPLRLLHPETQLSAHQVSAFRINTQ